MPRRPKPHQRRPKLPLCDATGKRRRSRDEAIKTAQRLQALDGDPMSAYRCNACNDWHVGHTPYALRTPPSRPPAPRP